MADIENKTQAEKDAEDANNRKSRIAWLKNKGFSSEDAYLIDDVVLHATKSAVNTMNAVIDNAPDKFHVIMTILSLNMIKVNIDHALEQISAREDEMWVPGWVTQLFLLISAVVAVLNRLPMASVVFVVGSLIIGVIRAIEKDRRKERGEYSGGH